MPEIRNEIPSDKELSDYLDESLKSSSISALSDYPDKQHHYHSQLDEALSYMLSRPIRSEFLSTLKNSLFLSLQRLNRLPRTDSFWKNTNLRPTVHKLTEFCNRILAHDADDVLSLLTITAMVIFHTGEFHRGCWTQLLSVKAVSLEWVVFAATFMEVCGADDSREFADFVRSSGMGTMITPRLQEIGDGGGSFLSEWSHRVLALLAKD